MKSILFGIFNTRTIAFSSLMSLLLSPKPLSGFLVHDYRFSGSRSHNSIPHHDDPLVYEETSTSLGCQLFGMNCNTPTDFAFSLKGFCKRGGDTDIHSDGWGVAFYEKHGIRQFHDVEAAASSPMAFDTQRSEKSNSAMYIHFVAKCGELTLHLP
jgi:hypothetical protein